jgi:phage terminase large subunit
MELLKKQEYAVYYLNDNETTELLYGGGAGGGKSALGVLWLMEQCQKYPKTRWLMGRAKLKALKETTLNTFFQLSSDLGLANQYKYNSQTNVITWLNGSEILLKDLFLYPSDPNFDSLGSLEITGAFVDECNQCTEKAVQIVKSRIRYKLREYKLIPKMLMTCNPAKNWTYSNFYNPSLSNSLPKYRKFIQALPTDNPYLHESYVETLRSLDKASRKRLLEGDWNFDDNPFAMFEYENILGMFTSEWVKPTEDRYMTCDISYQGADKFVIAIWGGMVVEKIIAIDKIDDVSVSKKIHELRIKHRVPLKNVVYDADGLQKFTRNSAKSGNLRGAIGFHNGSKAIKVVGRTENYKNLKAQCYFLFAEYVKANKVFIQDKSYDKQIIEELEQINMNPYDDEGKLSLEKKDKIKERLKRSPDFADCLMLRFYYEVRGQIKVRIMW